MVAMSTPLTDREITFVRTSALATCKLCRLDAYFVHVGSCTKDPPSPDNLLITIAYRGDLSLTRLDRLSKAFGTRLINLTCDTGTKDDPCHDPTIVVTMPAIKLPRRIAA